MRKLFLAALLLSSVAGCGRGWLPLYRGAHCCGSALPAAPASLGNGCSTCDPVLNYGNYGQSYYDNQVISESEVPLSTINP
ncbi:MAG: hypothetical protein KDB03_14870 [Planctomycetales bacterium]|nr:hypothetical protein [Planctomycetales bacterium]